MVTAKSLWAAMYNFITYLAALSLTVQCHVCSSIDMVFHLKFPQWVVIKQSKMILNNIVLQHY